MSALRVWSKRFLVPGELRARAEALPTLGAVVRCLPSVNALVHLDVGQLFKTSPAFSTDAIWPLAYVHTLVDSEVG